MSATHHHEMYRWADLCVETRRKLERCVGALRYATTTAHEIRTCICVDCEDARAALKEVEG